MDGEASAGSSAEFSRCDHVHPADSSKADVSSLSNYERKSDLSNDVSGIVTAKTFSDWNFPEKIGNYLYAPSEQWLSEHGDHSKRYYCPSNVQYVEGPKIWEITIKIYDWDTDWEVWLDIETTKSIIQNAPEDALSLTGDIIISTITYEFTITRTNENALGLAMLTDLEAKQDILSQPQISAINSIVDERVTVITFDDSSVESFYWVGEINQQTMIDAGLFDGDNYGWIKRPVSIKIGTSVASIGNEAFVGCFTLTGITIPDSVTTIGDEAFFNCTNLTSIIVKGKIQAEAETLLAYADVSPSIITTWNDASQEWVKEQNYLTEH